MKSGKRKKKELPGEENPIPKKLPSRRKPKVDEPEKGDDDSTTPDPTQPDTEITHRKRHEIGDNAVKKTPKK